MQFLKRILLIFKPFRWQMAALFAFIVCQQGLSLVSPYLQGRVVDALGSHKPILYSLEIVAAILAVELLLRIGVSHWRDRIELKYFDLRAYRYLSKLTLEKVLNLSLAQHVAQNSGVKENIISRGEHSTITFVYTMLYDSIPMLVEVSLIGAAIFYIGIAFGLTVMAGVTIFVGYMVLVNINFKNKLKKQEELYIESGKTHSEILRNVELVITNAQELRAVEEFDQSIGKATNFAQSIWVNYFKKMLLAQAIIILTSTAVTAIGVVHYYQSSITLGGLVVVIGWTSRMMSRVSNIGSIQRRVMNLYSSVRKYFELMDIEPEVKVITNPVKLDKVEGRIEFKHVTLRYPKRAYFKNDEVQEQEGQSSDPALTDISFLIEPGERVAIVGESGSGKTTLIYTLLRGQDPDEGQVLVDGQDLRLLDLSQFREAIGLVPQRVPLFDHSLRYNITYGLNGQGQLVSDERLEEVVRIARIDRFFGRMEKGFDTVIGEHGIRLSGGERQRVGIARALIKKPSILILDEATSSLDAENEALIKDAIDQASAGRTTVIIAHRFSTIRGVDKIIVMENGQIVGQDTHEKLSANCHEYQRLLRHQIAM